MSSKYERVRDWFGYLNERVRGVTDALGDHVDRLAEIKASRDILAHNAQVANDVYADKADKLARCTAGQSLEISSEYHRRRW